MSGSVPPTHLPPPPPPGSQNQASVLAPGIVGLFIQGIESGLVFAQFSQWFAALDRSESSVLTTIVIFVTVVGLYASSRLCQMTSFLIAVREVRSLGYALQLLGVTTYGTLGSLYVSLLLHQ